MNERYIAIRNWEKFQHKDVWRKSGSTPPWIKLYTRLRHNPDWTNLSQSQQGILVNLWIMYASAGRSVSETGARRVLSRNEAEARHWRDNLEALNRAGFIDFESQPSSAPVATREEKSRDIPITPTVTKTVVREGQRERRPGNGWVENLSSYTGCKLVRGEVSTAYKRDVLGKEQPPADWPYARPTRAEIAAALTKLTNREVA